MHSRTLASLQIENQRAATERELGERRAQDEALQAYLNQMGSLLLVRDLRNSEEDNEVRTLARARTLTVLDILGGERKRAVVTFLYEARLIEAPNPIVDISGADLQAAQLQLNPYVGVDLHGTYLNDGPDKDHRGALLYDCDLRDADLRDADLGYADLKRGHLNDGPDEDAIGAVLIRAVLGSTDLRDADLRDADLRDAYLGYADLRGANLLHADLSNADLSSAKGWTEEQLFAAESLKGATMPDGQILKSDNKPDRPTFGEWRKSKGNVEDR